MSKSTMVMVALLFPTLLASACSKSDDEDCASTCAASTTTGKGTPLSQDLAPVPGDGPTFSAITTAGYTVSWTAATDQVTSAAKLEYRLIRAGKSEEMDTVSEAMSLSGASILLDWSSGVLSKGVSDTVQAATPYAVLVRDEMGNIGLYSPKVLNDEGPTAGTGLAFSALSESGFTVSWGAATSVATAAENLEYKVVRASTVAEIDTLPEAEAASSVVMDWTKNKLSAQVSGLTVNTTVAVAVLVRDDSEVVALYAPKAVKTSAQRLIFKTSAQFTSTQLTPSTNADILCNSDSGKPAGRGAFKALISASDRIACTSANCSHSGVLEHTDWVMEPNSAYVNVGGEVLWTTNDSGIFIFSLSHPAIGNSSQFVWTGIDSGWVKATANCTNFSSTSSSDFGRAGTASSTTETSLVSVQISCNSTAAIYCVEQ